VGTNVACFGTNTGAVNLTVTGAAAPVIYNWSNGTTTEDLSNIPAGTYTVSVMDANECSATATVTISQPTELIVTVTAGIIPCNGTTTAVTVSATGGTAPYTGTGTFTRTAGTYQFTVTDSKGCSKTVSVTIAMPVECPAGCTKTQTITQDFVRTSISSGRYLWFNSVIDLDERCGNEPVIINVTNAKIQYKKNNTWITLNVPDAKVTFSANTFWSTTQFVNGKWETKAPLWTYGRNVFMAGLSYLVPSGGIPGGIDDVKWTASININREGVKIKWKWAAAVYTQFSSNYNALNVKPIDGYWFNAYFNRDKAGTPESFKNRLSAGGTGRGNNNYTGSFSSSRSVQCGDCGCEDHHYYNRGFVTDVSMPENESENEMEEKVTVQSDLKVVVKPNPSSNYFDLQIVSTDNKTPVTIRIVDMYGRVISGGNQRVSINSTLRVGDSWVNGTYIAEISQGDKRKVIKLIKAD
jgi:hypothetical protein